MCNTKTMKKTAYSLILSLGMTIGLMAADSEVLSPTADSHSSASVIPREGFQVAFGNITIGDKLVATAIEWNAKTGEARMLNAASFADKDTGQKGNLIGWVPLNDLQTAVHDLTQQIKTQKQSDNR